MVERVSEIRSAFLDYFKENDHEVVKSAPLVPYDDPTLMFVNAGMVPFKNYFTGVETPKFKRAVSSQKCVRAGGKHNDLENVGYTARHHTFFEMLGNFSFGDYFKEEAIYHAWEMVTKVLGLPKDKLVATIYHTDDEAFALWQKIAGLPESKIKRISTNDNFWSMGDTGPCGPCSELFYDHGDHIPGHPPGEGDEGDRFIEIWNLVFMQYEKKADGSKVNLPKPSIDTGMGLERISAIMQGKQNNFEVDLFQDIIDSSIEISKNDQDITSHRVITDHLRATSFLIADGVLPSNEGRGYVLRRIMRRAMRHVNQLGYKGPLLSQLFPVLQERMGNHFDELNKASSLILSTIESEEEQFGKTLNKGLKILEEELKGSSKSELFSGDVAFKLYDTYGFPVDLTADVLRAKNLEIDIKKFDELMEEQKTRGKDNWKGSGGVQDDNFWFELNEKVGTAEFTGYDKETDSAEILSLVVDGKEVQEVQSGIVAIVANKTPFYAESGGQIGDVGIIKSKGAELLVKDTQKSGKDLIVHLAEVKSGKIAIGDKVDLLVDGARRGQIKANHSATHLMHKALQEILGEHVAQKGSYVGSEILRFDFTHNKQVSRDELKKIESRVNEIIRQNTAVITELMDIESAKKSGAMALFGEKYDAKVRVLAMGRNADKAFSKELCGGIHVSSTGDIGMFKITSESSIASGVRRIEAITGAAVLNHFQSQEDILDSLAATLKSPKNEISKNVEALIENRKVLQKEISKLKQAGASDISEKDIIEHKGKKLLFKIIEDLDPKNARELAFQFKEQGFAAVVLVTTSNGKAGVIAASNDTASFNAVELVQKTVEKLGGKGGGGKPDLAQGGAPDDSQVASFKITEII